MKLQIDSIATIIIAAITAITSAISGMYIHLTGIDDQVNTLLEEAEYFYSYAQTEIEWLIDTQLENGALAVYPDDEGAVSVVPYFSCFAAMALANYATEESISASKAYLDWHIAHLNSSSDDVYGVRYSIYDYTLIIENGIVVEETPEYSYDSVDSYSAAFLSLMLYYWQASGDTEFILESFEVFEGVISTFDVLLNGGLTIASTNYQVKYLMDNCGVYEGLDDAATLMEQTYLLSAEESSEEYNKYKTLYDSIISTRDEILYNIEEELWDESSSTYYYAIQSDHYFESEWDTIYPDAIAQISPVISRVIEPDSERAISLYEEFNKNFYWQDIESFTSEVTIFYWSLIAQAAAMMSDNESVILYLESFNLLGYDKRDYPFNNSESYSIYMAAMICGNRCIEQADNLDPLNLYH